MIRRFYVHNFRCLINFELPLSSLSSILLIGNNGTGKTALGAALEILQKAARGTNRVGELVQTSDITQGRDDVPVRFELDVELNGKIYVYTLAFELPRGLKELRVLEEKLVAGGEAVYTREAAQVHLERTNRDSDTHFPIDWHLVALPIIQERSSSDPLFVFKQWLARILILRPIPSLISGDSEGETLQPNSQASDFGAWFSGVLAYAPAAYAKIDSFLKQIMPDMQDIRNPVVSKSFKSLSVQFSDHQGILTLPFAALSDGEKCFMICALVLAANEAYGPLFCFWDEPDNYLALSEIGHFVLALRKGFQISGQFVATSHNPEAILQFSEDNTFVLSRKSHLEPTIVRPLKELHVNGDLVGTLIRGDLES